MNFLFSWGGGGVFLVKKTSGQGNLAVSTSYWVKLWCKPSLHTSVPDYWGYRSSNFKKINSSQSPIFWGGHLCFICTERPGIGVCSGPPLLSRFGTHPRGCPKREVFDPDDLTEKQGTVNKLKRRIKGFKIFSLQQETFSKESASGC